MKSLEKATAAFIVFGLMALPMLAVSQESRSMLSGDVIALEANSVELVGSSGGDLAQLLVEGCEMCGAGSYLPSRQMEVTLAGEPLSPSQYSRVSGLPATLVVDVNTKLVKRASFALPRGEGE